MKTDKNFMALKVHIDFFKNANNELISAKWSSMNSLNTAVHKAHAASIISKGHELNINTANITMTNAHNHNTCGCYNRCCNEKKGVVAC